MRSELLCSFWSETIFSELGTGQSLIVLQSQRELGCGTRTASAAILSENLNFRDWKKGANVIELIFTYEVNGFLDLNDDFSVM